MKKLFGLLLVTGVLFFAAVSCGSNDDDYGIDGQYLSLGLFSINEAADDTVTLDDGRTLYIRVSSVPYHGEFDGERVVMTYNVLAEQDGSAGKNYIVRMLDYGGVLTKSPVYESGEELGNEPVHIRKSWFTSKYLNLNIEILLASLDGVHTLNLVVDEDNEGADGDNVYVELRHKIETTSAGSAGEGELDLSDVVRENAGGYIARYAGYVSFDMTGLVPAGKTSVNVHLSCLNYQGQTVTESGEFIIGR